MTPEVMVSQRPAETAGATVSRQARRGPDRQARRRGDRTRPAAPPADPEHGAELAGKVQYRYYQRSSYR